MNNKLPKKLQDAIVSFNIKDLPQSDVKFFYYFLNYVNFKEEVNLPMPTMGAKIKKTGLEIAYHPKFVEENDIKVLAGVLAHEVMHFVTFHHIRTMLLNFDHKYANVAQDNYINHHLKYDFLNYNTPGFNYTIKDGILTEYPSDFNEKPYFENLYFYYLQKRLEYEHEKSQHSILKKDSKYKFNPYTNQMSLDLESDKTQKEIEDLLNDGGDDENEGAVEGVNCGNGCGNKTNSKQKLSDSDRKKLEDVLKGIKDKKEKGFDPSKSSSKFESPNENGLYPDGSESKIPKDMRNLLDMVDQWQNGSGFDTHAPAEGEGEGSFCEDGMNPIEAQIKVQSVLDNLKQRGLIPANIENVIENIKPKKKDYLKFIKRASSVLFKKNKIKTYAVPNIFGIDGLKGFRKNGFVINWISDTSDSMQGLEEKVAAYLVQKDIQINLIQIDAEIKNVRVITKKDFRKFKTYGGGGTVLQQAVDLIKKDKIFSKCHTVITTDGQTDVLDFSGYEKNVLYITTDKKDCISNIPQSRLKIIDVDVDLL